MKSLNTLIVVTLFLAFAVGHEIVPREIQAKIELQGSVGEGQKVSGLGHGWYSWFID